MPVRCTANTAKAFNVASGTGTVVMGLAAVIIGSTIFKKIKSFRITTGVLFGMIFIRLVFQSHLPQACVHRIQTL